MFIADPKPAQGQALRSQIALPEDNWQQLIQPVESFLESVSTQLAAQVNAFDPALSEYADYALRGHGKHLRPALVALSAQSVGKASEAHVTAAVVIEMVHLATLIHDDVTDEAEIRRAQPTLATKWGNETAVLFGDCLFAEALRLAASFPTPEVCRSVAAATNTVCAGEIRQTRNRGNFDLTLDEYLRIIDMKTAELFSLSCDLAAFLTGATGHHREVLKRFGRSFGVAYQIFDDCQDVFGSESKAGKSLGTDLAKGKLTLPMIELRRRVSNGDLIKLEQLFQHGRGSSLKDLRKLLLRHSVFDRCAEVICSKLEEARAALSELDSSNRLGPLSDCTRFLEQQLRSLGQA